MPIYDNEFDIPDLRFEDSPNAWLGIGNAQYFLDEHYAIVTEPRIQKAVWFIVRLLGNGHNPMLTPYRHTPTETNYDAGY